MKSGRGGGKRDRGEKTSVPVSCYMVLMIIHVNVQTRLPTFPI